MSQLFSEIYYKFNDFLYILILKIGKSCISDVFYIVCESTADVFETLLLLKFS